MVENIKDVDRDINNGSIDCMALSIGFSLIVAIIFFAALIYLLFSGAVDLIESLNYYGR